MRRAPDDRAWRLGATALGLSIFGSVPALVGSPVLHRPWQLDAPVQPGSVILLAVGLTLLAAALVVGVVAVTRPRLDLILGTIALTIGLAMGVLALLPYVVTQAIES